ncbi:MAG: transposase [Candidatus Aenigmatarchaeota archaeon]
MKISLEKCPKCGSNRVEVIEASYPQAYECKDCKHIFVKSPKALVDE